MRSDRERFEVRLVVEERRVYVYLTSDRKYHDACLIADKARDWLQREIVILDGHEGMRVLYDSRKFRKPAEIIRR